MRSSKNDESMQCPARPSEVTHAAPTASRLHVASSPLSESARAIVGQITHDATIVNIANVAAQRERIGRRCTGEPPFGTISPVSSPGIERVRTFVMVATMIASSACGDRVNATRREPNIVQVAIGSAVACARLSTGRVRCFGDNNQGQLGDGTTLPRSRPVDVVGVEGATSLSSGWEETCVAARGNVLCWGIIRFFRSTEPTPTPTVVRGIEGAVEVVAHNGGGCARTSAGRVWCWGDNSQGQLGIGTTDPMAMPVEVVDLPQTARLWGGPYRATCAVAMDDTVRCWGSYGNTTTARPALIRNLPRTTATAAGTHAFCAATEQDIRCWGQTLSHEATADAVVTIAQPGATGLAIHRYSGGFAEVCGLWPNRGVECWNVSERAPQPTLRADFRDPEAVYANEQTMCSIERLGGALYCSGPALRALSNRDAGEDELRTARRIDGIL